jgi:hypothetical protein
MKNGNIDANLYIAIRLYICCLIKVSLKYRFVFMFLCYVWNLIHGSQPSQKFGPHLICCKAVTQAGTKDSWETSLPTTKAARLVSASKEKIPLEISPQLYANILYYWKNLWKLLIHRLITLNIHLGTRWKLVHNSMQISTLLEKYAEKTFDV